ncbi:MAG: glycoside hydrolase family 32 protein [Candidatus Brocadiia bacterium]|nr:MAG: glycoside hydrolase family 32 protein [Candidatus Brocadiia bacterium]
MFWSHLNHDSSTKTGSTHIAGRRCHSEKNPLSLLMLIIFVGGQIVVAEENLNEQMRALRERLAADPHRPGYHFVTPEGKCSPFDPNGAIFWKGRYHMFYIFQDSRGHNWGHVSSIDLVHWRHHPTGLVSGMFSGNCFINKDGVPTMCYHQTKQGGHIRGNAMAVALDDNLDTWKKLGSNPITPKTVEGDDHHGKYNSWDPFGWLEGDTYYAIFGGTRPAIAKSKTLEGPWNYVGNLMAHTVGDVNINEDISCADLFKFGDKYMLLCISHKLGCRYYIGEWKNEQFYPEFHERMSWIDNDYFAPESLLDGKGRRIMWAWLFDGRKEKARKASEWSGTMSLPRVLTPAKDGSLLITPPEELEILRYNPKSMKNLTVKADSEMAIKDVSGNSIEIVAEMVPNGAKQFGVKVCVSPDGQEETVIYYDTTDSKIKIDTEKSSLDQGPKSVEAGPLKLNPGEPLKLRIFVDKSVVEVFANDRQAVMRRIYPTKKDSVNVVVFSKGGSVKVPVLKAWDMMPSNPY